MLTSISELDLSAAMANPLWEEQCSLERGMLNAGADAVRDMERKAKERGQVASLTPVRKMIQEWLPQVAEGLKDDMKGWRRSRGVTPLALQYLEQVDPEVASLIAMRTCLDSMAQDRRGILSIASEIGRLVGHEVRARAWRKADREDFAKLQKKFKFDHATAHHRRVVTALMARRKFGAEEEWSREACYRVGLALLDNLIRITGWFSVQPEDVSRFSAKRQPAMLLVPHAQLLSWLSGSMDRMAEMRHRLTPCVIPPRRWTNTTDGGYWTPEINTPRLIRFKASQEQQQHRAADDYDALDMPDVYTTINWLQGVPWAVNRRVFEVMEKAQLLGRAIGKMPDMRKGGQPLPDQPPGMPSLEMRRKEGLAAYEAAMAKWGEANPTALRTWKRKASRVTKANIRQLGQQESFGRTLQVAKTYLDYEQFYFPYMLDFRGRIYPISAGLQPQGDDVARGLLEFAEGKPVTEENGGAAWLALQLSAMWGFDKDGYDERIEWVYQREDKWRRIAADPLGTIDEWANKEDGPHKADKPWQALAAIFDWVGFLEHGFGYVSYAAIVVDGTCNGIQHLAALVRDEESGYHVNLVPGDKPRDIYKHCAKRLQERLEAIVELGGHNADHARYWLTTTQWDIPRGLTKRQVMVLPYGGTRDSYFGYTRQWLEENRPIPDDTPDEELEALYKLRTARVAFLASEMWASVNDDIKAPKEVMKWLQDCAKKVVQGNQPILWESPIGFVVRHFYGQQASRKVETTLDGQRVQLRQMTTTSTLDSKKQLQGIAPNFVHSLDAAALQRCILRCRQLGLHAFTAVHDAYGSHAADMGIVARELRAAFVWVHEQNPLAGFRKACWRVLTDYKLAHGETDPFRAGELADEELPPLPEMGSLDLRQVLDSDYFFA